MSDKRFCIYFNIRKLKLNFKWSHSNYIASHQWNNLLVASYLGVAVCLVGLDIHSKVRDRWIVSDHELVNGTILILLDEYWLRRSSVNN